MLTEKQIDAEWGKHKDTLKGWDYCGTEVMYEGAFEEAARAIESAACADRDARIAELERELAEARKDAERYRWLRDDGGAGQFAAGKSLRFSDEYPNLEEVEWFFGSDLDSNIDAAMKGQQ